MPIPSPIPLLRIEKQKQKTLGQYDMFSIEITPVEKRMYMLDTNTKAELWFYKDLEKNRKEYLALLCNRLGIANPNKLNKITMVNMLDTRIVYC